MDRSTNESCPCSSSSSSDGRGGTSGPSESITVSVTPTTGGQFDLSVDKSDSVEALKKLISKRLKVPKERICLLHRERQLRDGTIQENQLVNGSRLTLLPSVETGLLAQRPEQSVMQALESLNDSQVNDFLSGKSPLNLTMRLGDHMMLIQLQLSTVAPASAAGSKKRQEQHHHQSQSSNQNQQATTPVSALPQVTSIPQVPQSSAATSTISSKPAQQLPGLVQSPPTSNSSSTSTTTSTNCPCDVKPVLDTKALAEASRNLTQTLKQLSSEVLTSKSDVEGAISLKRRPGAIIESMHHHGKGVYSGTFSGTLNPELQDRFGRPKRDISTIIHILNDLLCATPQYRAAAQEAACSSNKPAPQVTAVSSPSSPAGTSDGSSSTERAATESDENRATRGKMERLRLVLGQRRERRRAMRSQPYPTGHDHVTA